MIEVDTNACVKCSTSLWIGDRFCRNCGTRSDDGSELHEIDLSPEPNDQSLGPQRRLNLLGLVLFVAVAIAALAGFNALANDTDDGESDDADQPETAEAGLPDNPPERQAALDAFETARGRSDMSLADIKAAFGIDGEINVLDRNDLDSCCPQGVRSQPWTSLGSVDTAPYRIDPRLRTVIESWEESGTWVATDITTIIPMTSISVSPSHLAIEVGARISVRDRTTGREQASLPGRLIPSTGNGFLVQICEPECALTRLRADGSVTDDTLEAGAYSPPLDGVARISPAGTAAGFVDGDAIWWIFDEPSEQVLTGFPDGEPVIDLAWLSDSSGLIVLASDSVWAHRFDEPPVPLPIEVTDPWAIGLTTPEG